MKGVVRMTAYEGCAQDDASAKCCSQDEASAIRCSQDEASAKRGDE